jgi:uncharacterized spore protein YtfJ
MTTDFQTPTAYHSSPGYDEAVTAAERAGEPNAFEGVIERMAERVGGKASVSAVFGDPIERDGITVIPVAKVRWGFGGGAGRGPVAVGPGIAGRDAPSGSMTDDPAMGGSGTGGGGGVTADPIGYLEIGPDGASFRPIMPAMPSPAFLFAAGITAFLALSGLAKLIRR